MTSVSVRISTANDKTTECVSVRVWKATKIMDAMTILMIMIIATEES